MPLNTIRRVEESVLGVCSQGVARDRVWAQVGLLLGLALDGAWWSFGWPRPRRPEMYLMLADKSWLLPSLKPAGPWGSLEARSPAQKTSRYLSHLQISVIATDRYSSSHSSSVIRCFHRVETTGLVDDPRSTDHVNHSRIIRQ